MRKQNSYGSTENIENVEKLSIVLLAFQALFTKLDYEFGSLHGLPLICLIVLLIRPVCVDAFA